MKSMKRLMKSEREVEKICRKQVEEYLTENYEAISRSGAIQMLAAAFYVLHTEFGFGEKRLKRLKSLIEGLFVLMKVGVIGRKFNPEDCMKFLKEKLNIDFEESDYEGWEFNDKQAE